MVTTEHVGHEEIVVAVEINIGHVCGHGRHAHIPPGVAGHSTETSASFIKPKLVRRKEEVVANVKIGRPVAVKVPEEHSQTPVPRRFRERLPFFIKKCAAGPGDGCEMSFPVIEVKQV